MSEGLYLPPPAKENSVLPLGFHFPLLRRRVSYLLGEGLSLEPNERTREDMEGRKGQKTLSHYV